MQRSKTDEKMQQEERKVCPKKIEEKRKKNGYVERINGEAK